MARRDPLVWLGAIAAGCSQPSPPARADVPAPAPVASVSTPDLGTAPSKPAPPSPKSVVELKSTPTPIEGAPSPRIGHCAVWTGTEMLVVGGDDAVPSETTGYAAVPPNPLAGGAALIVATNTWRPIATKRAAPRFGHGAVWTGTQMIVWGGLSRGNKPTATGERYDPKADRWQRLSGKGAPSARRDHTAVWTGTQMIVWGGTGPAGALGNGAAYDPRRDAWRPLSRDGTPAPRTSHVAVWTGTQMIVWGGQAHGMAVTDGGAYDPVADAWRPLTARHAPVSNPGFVGVWTGTELVVWGGERDGIVSPAGSRYDPAKDAWRPMTTTNAIARREPIAAWTGRVMAVVGEPANGDSNETLGLYDPATDAWQNAVGPYPTSGGSLSWTGTELVAWGGFDGTNDTLEGTRIALP